jgi:hypothetical protein
MTTGDEKTAEQMTSGYQQQQNDSPKFESLVEPNAINQLQVYPASPPCHEFRVRPYTWLMTQGRNDTH